MSEDVSNETFIVKSIGYFMYLVFKWIKNEQIVFLSEHVRTMMSFEVSFILILLFIYKQFEFQTHLPVK